MAAALTIAGCATTGSDTVDGTLETCGQACSVAVAVVLLLPCAVAGAAGCVMGGCTRCNEGPDPVGIGDDETAASDVNRELPPSPTVADAAMRY